MVKVLRGQYKKKGGKIANVDKRRVVVYVEGIDNIKKDGSKAPIALQPSNLQITELNLDDRKRKGKIVHRVGVKK